MNRLRNINLSSLTRAFARPQCGAAEAKTRDQLPGETAAQEGWRATASQAATAIDWSSDRWLLRAFRATAGIVLAFQAICLTVEWRSDEAGNAAILPLHFLIIMTALLFLGLTYLRGYQHRMPSAIIGGCSLLFAATAALSILELNDAPLAFTITITMIGAAALVPWNWRWQTGLAVAGIASMAAFTVFRPQIDPQSGYVWLAIAAAASIAHYAALSGERYRRELASRITALQLNHRQLLAERTQRAAAADVSDRIHRQLGESEAKLRKIFETSSDAITINRLSDGCYIDLNAAFGTLGYSREEVLAGSAAALGIWANPAQLRQFMKTLATTGSVVNLEVEIRVRDGHVVPFLISAKVMELAGEQCVVSIGRDQADRSGFARRPRPDARANRDARAYRGATTR